MRKRLIAILSILFATFFISCRLYQLNLIQGSSMYPTYKNMQLTLIDKRSSDFQCGDVVAFYCPALECVMVKRIIALPGQTVLISDGNVLVDGTKSAYINDYVDYGGTASEEIRLSENQFFVMGDNYNQSRDSRYEDVGCVSRENILGKIIPNRAPG